MKKSWRILLAMLISISSTLSVVASDNITWSGYARNNFQVGEGGRQGQGLHTGFGYRSRIQEGLYYESNLSTKLPNDALFMLTLAEYGDTHNYAGTWPTESGLALRQMFLEMNNVADVKGLTLWFGNRYYRGMDYYPFDTFPFDNINITGGGVAFGDTLRHELVVGAKKDASYIMNADSLNTLDQDPGYVSQRMIYSYKATLTLNSKQFVRGRAEYQSVSESKGTYNDGADHDIILPTATGLRAGLQHTLKYDGGANNTFVDYAAGDVSTAEGFFTTPSVEAPTLKLQGGGEMSGVGSGVMYKKNSKALTAASCGDKDFGNWGTFYGVFYNEQWNTSNGNDIRGKQFVATVRPFLYASKRLNVGVETDYVDYGKKLSTADVGYVQVAPMLEYSLHGKLWGWPKLKVIFANAFYKEKVNRYGRDVWSAYNLSAGFELVW